MGRPEDRDQEHGPPTPCDGEASEAHRPPRATGSRLSLVRRACPCVCARGIDSPVVSGPSPGPLCRLTIPTRRPATAGRHTPPPRRGNQPNVFSHYHTPPRTSNLITGRNTKMLASDEGGGTGRKVAARTPPGPTNEERGKPLTSTA